APGVLNTDSDADGDTLTVTDHTDPSHGNLSINTDGSFTYTPDANYNGSDSFDYTIDDGHGAADSATVSITINPVEDAPDASDDSYTLDEDTILSVTAPGLLANDYDADGDTITVTSHTAASHGSLSVDSDGSFDYTPDPDYNGSDSFSYTIDDGHGGTDTATVTFTINPVNDPPVVDLN